MRTRTILCFISFTLLLGLLAGLVLLFPEHVPFTLPEGRGERLPVSIRQGMSARQAAEEFVGAGIIGEKSAKSFSRWMSWFSIDRNLRPGLYHIRKGSSWEAARQMREAQPEVFSVTLLPGTDVLNFGELLSRVLMTDKDLEELMADEYLFPQELRPLLPDTAEGRLAFLFPETYRLSFPDARELVQASASLWWRQVGSTIPSNRRDKKTFEELAICASLVEREGRNDTERPRIAGVIENRIRDGMQLQIDATVVYAWKKEGREITRVLFKDLEIDSPYNTYRVNGLPPAPICLPSGASWSAVLNPEGHDYLYYVAKPDGEHLFARDYAEHQRNIKAARSK
ncbi:MAG: endolytic transglycosylase MltG [Synergistaceae bacterium]|nr:endolytic transglycosylase MltG [Synergistota bacterium]NLM70598.1 endolytic transglycosylase MltG [Synergistaceae bacterium]